MLGRLDEDESASPAVATRISAPGEAQMSAQQKPKTPRAKTVPPRDRGDSGKAATGESVSPAGPLYMRLERKETRLRADQYSKLTEYARRLNRVKSEGGERITENTLIRIAIDLLLDRADVLEGSNESELRNSVTL